jgi:hypothetical protein
MCCFPGDLLGLEVVESDRATIQQLVGIIAVLALSDTAGQALYKLCKKATATFQ